MYIASEELSERLFELSGWDTGIYQNHNPLIPAYSAGFLMRKLRAVDDPDGQKCSIYVEISTLSHSSTARAVQGISSGDTVLELPERTAVSPENALASVAVAMFELDYLKKGAK